MLEYFEKALLSSIADIDSSPAVGAFNIRKNGQSEGRRSTENIVIESKSDRPGIDIFIKPFTKGEHVHIPVIVTTSGLNDLVYNDFYVGEGADVRIVAGCGIHNDGRDESRHDGIHRFHIDKNAKVVYVEKHYGEGEGSGGRVLNPVTVAELGEGAVCEMEMVQIEGVDSTKRDTKVSLAAGAKLIITERLLTSGEQTAESDIEITLNGDDASAQLISRSVAKGTSVQAFKYNAVGNTLCKAHIQCDSIIMDGAHVSSTPAITANSADAAIIHEAAIGRINNDQITKLMTLGLTEQEAEDVIIQGFLK